MFKRRRRIRYRRSHGPPVGSYPSRSPGAAPPRPDEAQAQVAQDRADRSGGWGLLKRIAQIAEPAAASLRDLRDAEPPLRARPDPRPAEPPEAHSGETPPLQRPGVSQPSSYAAPPPTPTPEAFVPNTLRAPEDEPGDAPVLVAREEVVDALVGKPYKRSFRAGQAAGALFAVLVLIAAFAPIASGVVAFGRLTPSQARQTVQHPAGGVVEEILVRDGATVAEGDLLVRLTTVAEGAAVGVNSVQIVSLRAEETVRTVEAAGGGEIVFPQDLIDLAKGDAATAAVLDSQRNAYEARRALTNTSLSQIDARRAQIEQAIAAAEAQITATREQNRLIESEIEGLRQLFEKGLAPKTRLLALERASAQYKGTIESTEADNLGRRAELQELSATRSQILLDARSKAAEALRAAQAELAAAGYRDVVARDALDRMQVRAPKAGRVVNMAVKTVGGVVRPGETILEIVPTTDRLSVRARIRPRDADDVREGARATVRFDAINQAAIPRIHGTVVRISADSIEDERTGEAYFEAEIEIPVEEARRLPPQAYIPGLPAEVLIHAGSRTLLAYLFSPIDRVAFSAMRG